MNDRNNVELAKNIDIVLNIHRGDDKFEARDEFFDFLVSVYGDELSDAFSRRGTTLVPGDVTRQATADKIIA